MFLREYKKSWKRKSVKKFINKLTRNTTATWPPKNTIDIVRQKIMNMLVFNARQKKKSWNKNNEEKWSFSALKTDIPK